MKEYLVKSPVKYGGKIRNIGEVVSMDDEAVKPVLAAGNVELHDQRAQGELVKESIKAASVMVANGLLSVDQAVDQIASQVQGSVKSQLRAEILDGVEEAKARAEAETRRKAQAEEEVKRQERKQKEDEAPAHARSDSAAPHDAKPDAKKNRK